MDAFFEQIVVKKKTALDWLIILLSLLGGILVIGAVFVFIRSLVVAALFGVGYGVWWLISNRNIEYEYCVTNGDIDIDCIIDKRKRKRIVAVAGRKLESLLPYDPARSTAGYQRVVVAAPSANAEGLWGFTYHSKKNGHTLVVFQPEERVLNALYGGLPRLVQMDTAKAARELGITLLSGRPSHGDEE